MINKDEEIENLRQAVFELQIKVECLLEHFMETDMIKKKQFQKRIDKMLFDLTYKINPN